MPAPRRSETTSIVEPVDGTEVPRPTPVRQPWALYLGLLAFGLLTVLTVRQVTHEWHRSLRHERSRTVFDFVQQGTPVRPTDAPGAIAWLDQQIERYVAAVAGQSLDPSAPLAQLTDTGPIPDTFGHLADAMASPVSAEIGCDLRFLSPEETHTAGLGLPSEDGLLFRTQRFLTCARSDPAPLRDWLVLTRRKDVDTPLTDLTNGSNRFLQVVAPYLFAVRERLDQALTASPLPEIAGPQPPRPVRLYALAEDSSFLSLPDTRGASLEATRSRVLEEGREFRKRPNLPSYVYNEFFFRFGEPWRPEEARYSGFYLDIAGQGLVVTLLVPQESEGVRWVAALDLSLAIDWQAFARQVEAPLVAHVAEVVSSDTAGDRPWTALRAALGEHSSDPRLDPVLAELAARERRTRQEPRSIPSHQTAVVEGQGAVAAFQVFRNQWLVILFPELTFRFPWLLVALLALSGAFLLVGFERTRRQAEAARRRALDELRERQSLLETMQVPLVVVDPNSDRVIFGNRAAQELGIKRGSCIGERIDPGDPSAREHYLRMQVASEQTRRAYGVPLEIQRGGGVQMRHVIVRSVAVAAPLETFHADERHRLAILFVVDPEADLPIFTRRLEARYRNDERRRLAGLLSHGVETLARVLRHRLEAGSGASFDRWLADYLGRRLEVCAWLFEHWRDHPPLPPETSLGPAQVARTLDRLVEILAVARDSPELRTRLGWANGVLSLPGEEPPVRIDLHWPDSFLLTSPVRGGVGFFLEELLVNAIAHGAAGSQPEVSIHIDPVRRELRCRIVNEIDDEADRRPEEDLEPYGGRRIVSRLAELFGWRNLRFERHGGRFEVRWEIPVSDGPETSADD